jgi:preprotein translocase subunit YajC
MDFSNIFISNAFAEGAAAQSDAGLASLIPMVILFVVFYFVLIRPQSKRAKTHKKMVDALAKGDEVVTNGGILGRIIKVVDNFIIIEICKEKEIEIKIQRHAIASILPKGTIKSI